MTNERLEEIERSLTATTPGEWHVWESEWIYSKAPDYIVGDIICNPPDGDSEESLEFWGPNVAFIIAAHNSYIPELLAEVKRLQTAAAKTAHPEDPDLRLDYLRNRDREEKANTAKSNFWFCQDSYSEGFLRGWEAALAEELWRFNNGYERLRDH